MVVAPVSTIDFAIKTGEEINIEQRHQDEFLTEYTIKNEPLISAWNPVFDITPGTLNSAMSIVTEQGIIRNPAEQGVHFEEQS